MRKVAVIAIGGNSLIKDNKKVSFKDQYDACVDTCKHLISIVKAGYKMVITHGNGPQVGFDLRRSELSKNELPIVPLDACVGDTQGNIGYCLQMALKNELYRNNISKDVITVVTQVVVDPKDSSFLHPTKPIGSFMDEEMALMHKRSDGWDIVEDAGRGYRRVVPSPSPIEIVEIEAIKNLIENEVITIACGGGGIPVVRDRNGFYSGIEAVIDKDSASCLLAKNLNAELFIISTAVEQVSINFGKPDQKALLKLSIVEAEKYIQEGHFAKGSMLPKVKACVDFVKTTGNRALITSPEHLEAAIRGETGTLIVSR